MTESLARPAIEGMRPAPVGMPADHPAPPIVAQSGDAFAALRIVALVARLPRGSAVPLTAITDHLNAAHLDWLFSERVVADALLQLAANWAADYRSTHGIVLDDGPAGATLTVEDSSRVDPWIVRQAQRLDAECRAALLDFSRSDRATGRD